MEDKYYIDTTDISRWNLHKCGSLLADVRRELRNPSLTPIQIDELKQIEVQLDNDYSYIQDMRNERSN